MSRENVEVVREWVENTVLRGDIGDLGDLSFLDTEIVYEDEILPDHVGEAYRRHDGFRKAWRRAIEPWEDIEGRLEWARDAGDEVVSCHWSRIRGQGSGVDAEIRYAYLWRFRGSKIVYCKSFANPAEALEAAGLRE